VRALAAVLALGWAAGARAQAADPDPWLGQDKALHFAASAGIAGTGYGLAGLWQPPPDEVHRLALVDPVAMLESLRTTGFDVQAIPSYGALSLPPGGAASQAGRSLADAGRSIPGCSLRKWQMRVVGCSDLLSVQPGWKHRRNPTRRQCFEY